MSKMFRNLTVLMALSGENDVDLAKMTGLSSSTIHAMRNGKYSSRIDTINVIAQHYGVPIDFLINGEIELKCDEWHRVI